MEESEIKDYKQRIRTLDMFQYAVKIIINQVYGAFGNQYFYFRNKDIAESITMQGRDLIKYSIDVLNNYFMNRWHLDTALHEKLGLTNYKINKIEDSVVIYVDTDSNYVNFKLLINSIEGFEPKGKDAIQFVLDVINNRIKNYLNNAFNVYADKYNTENRMVFKMENISDCGIWVAKKCYVLRVNFQEFFFSERKLKAKGLPCTKPSYPKVARNIHWDIIKDLLDINSGIVLEKHIIPKLKEHYEKFKTYSVDEISFNYYVNGLEKYVLSKDDYYLTTKSKQTRGKDGEIITIDANYAVNKTTGVIHTMKTKKKGIYEAEITEEIDSYYFVKGIANKVKGAMYFNNFIITTGNTKFNKVRSGDKIKFYYCNNPYNAKNNSFCYPQGQFTDDLSMPIDYKEHFFKSVITPVNALLEAMGKQILDDNLKRDIKVVIPVLKAKQTTDDIFPLYCVHSETLEHYEIPNNFAKYIFTKKDVPDYLIDEYDNIISKFGTDLVIMSALNLQKYITQRTRTLNAKLNKSLMDMFTETQLKHYTDALLYLKKKYKFKVDFDDNTKETVLYLPKCDKRFILSTDIIRKMKCLENYITAVTDLFEDELTSDDEDDD